VLPHPHPGSSRRPYNNLNEIVGTTKRSIEAIPSAWLRRNVLSLAREVVFGAPCTWRLSSGHVDAESAPELIGKAHLPDQSPNFWRDAGPADTPTRFPAPEGAKACPMPPDNRFRLHDHEGVQNTRRDPSRHTKIMIEVTQDRPR
jgi:hypothetical protein